MGLSLIYECGNEDREFAISRTDWDIIKSIDEFLHDDIDTLFIVTDIGQSITVAVGDVRRAAENTAEFLKTHSHVLPYVYEFKPEYYPGIEVPPESYGSGAISGIRLPGDLEYFYTIRAGLETCVLEQWKTGNDGKGVLKGQEDFRTTPSFMTTNMGEMLIRKRRPRTNINKIVGEILEFTKICPDKHLMKTMH